MIMPVYGADQIILPYVERALKTRFDPTMVATIGFADLDTQVLICGAVYHNYAGHDVLISIAAHDPRWSSRRNWGVLLAYPFLDLKTVRATALVAKKNKRSRRLVEAIGFRLEGCARRGFDGHQDACLYGILREDAEKWIRRAIDGNKGHTAAADAA